MCACSLEGNKLRARNETEMRQTERQLTDRALGWPALNYFLSPGDKSNCNEPSYFVGRPRQSCNDYKLLHTRCDIQMLYYIR